MLVFAQQSFWDSFTANPAVAVSAIGALVAALITLVTFALNFRANQRQQKDTAFYEALRRFGDESGPVLRSSAAGMLAQMAGQKILFRRPYFATVLDQLTVGLRIETDPIVLYSITKAISHLARLDQRQVIRGLHETNLRLQEDLVTAFANLFALMGANQAAECDAHWERVARLTPYSEEVLRDLVQMPNRSSVYLDSLHAPRRDDSSTGPEKVGTLNAAEERVRLTAQCLKENCRLLESSLQSIFPAVSHKSSWDATRGLVKVWHRPLVMRFRRRPPKMSGVFLTQLNLSNRLVQRIYFKHAMLSGAKFANSFVFDSTFAETYLREADFSGALIKSSKSIYFKLLDSYISSIGSYRHMFVKPLWLLMTKLIVWGLPVASGASFSKSQLQNSDFRGADLGRTLMQGADVTAARLYMAMINADSADFWKETDWWAADFESEKSWELLRSDPTRNALTLLYENYRENLPRDENAIHPSVRAFIAENKAEN